MNNDYYYEKFVPEFALLQIKKEEWRCLARRNKVLNRHGIKTKIYLWEVSPSILNEILEEIKK